MLQQKMGNCEACPTENVEIKFYRNMWLCVPCYDKELAIAPVAPKSNKLGCKMCGRADEGMHITLRYGNLPMCDTCWEREQNAQAENMTPEKQQARVDAQKLSIEMSRNIDNTITVRTDVFNAKTVAIVDLKKVIDENPEIVNKPFTLAAELKERFTKLQEKGFALQNELTDVATEQRAIQVYMNNLANQLRAEEREQLKIADISYKPGAVKIPAVKALKTTGTSSKKATKADIKKAAQELGIAEFTLASFVVMSGGNLETAVSKIRKSMEDAKASK